MAPGSMLSRHLFQISAFFTLDHDQHASSWPRGIIQSATKMYIESSSDLDSLWDLEHSDCQVGTVDVLRPLPKLLATSASETFTFHKSAYPVIILAVMNCAREKDEA